MEDVRRVTLKAGEVSRLDFDSLFDRVRPDDRAIADFIEIPDQTLNGLATWALGLSFVMTGFTGCGPLKPSLQR